MRLIGEFYAESAFSWKDKFEEKNIICKWEEVQGLQKINMWRRGRSPKIKLFVEDNDYEKAREIMNEVEKRHIENVELYGKEVDKVMLKVFVGIILLLILLFYVFGRFASK